MRRIEYTRPGVATTDVAAPGPLRAAQVRISVAFASLCGTDLHILRGDFDRLFGEAPSVPLGHEASGYVAELGPEATAKGLAVGDRVTFYFNRYCGACRECRTGREQFCTEVESSLDFMADEVVLDEQQVFRIPDALSMVAAALVEPLTVAMRGIDLARVQPGASVAVFGGGGIGQIVATLAAHAGAAEVTVFEPVPDKRALALRRGADHAVDPLAEDPEGRSEEITGGRGFDVVIEASGSPAACATSMRIAARGATVVFLATYSPAYTFELPMGDAFMREITLVTGVYQSPYLFPRAIALAPRLQLDELATEFAPDQAEEGFAAQAEGRSVKTVFSFAGGRSGHPGEGARHD